MSSLISFLSGTAFRMIWGEISSYLAKHQDHKNEMDQLRLQGTLDQERHTRQKELIQQQHEFGIKEIRVAGDIALDKSAADAFAEAVKATNSKTGMKWVDAWNAAIRPAGATMALVVMFSEVIFLAVIAAMSAHSVQELAAVNIVPNSTRDVLFAFVGLFVADRAMGKRGK